MSKEVVCNEFVDNIVKALLEAPDYSNWEIMPIDRLADGYDYYTWLHRQKHWYWRLWWRIKGWFYDRFTQRY